MSIITEYRETQEALKTLEERLEKMSRNHALLKEREFDQKLRTLMAEYGKSLRDIVSIIDPEYRKNGVPEAARQRAQRVVKVYKNPATGEVVETKGGNNKMLKLWKQQHGADVVDSWRTQ
ncbi:histone-like nucleoid-structuring protein, MvaT/MvaU family (plasmid) [Pseudomonas corrugata]|uniref:histone-like nucleoid-structuring protein, MvaT/MvaU family n=1 Tax=Pseudomonas corrugata TaxID=47879 RepID=UPI003D817D64